MSRRGKRCLSCQHVNDEYAGFCVRCNETLQGVPPQELEPGTPTIDAGDEAAPCPGTLGEKAGAAALVLTDGVPLRFALKPDCIVGRGAQVDLTCVPRCEPLSGQHARFVCGKDGWTVEDLHSTNGTFVNAARLPPGEPLSLCDGDRISLGNVGFIFKTES